MCLFLGILFRSYLLDYVVLPVAILLLYVWRIIRSVDQAIYWSGLLFLALSYAAFHVFFRQLQKPAALLQTPPSSSNATLENVRYWRTMILVTHDEIEKPNMLKREMGKMLASMLATKLNGNSTVVETYNALKQRQIPLPEHIYAFLFPEESSGTERTFKQVLQAIRQTPRRWVRKWTNRDMAEYQKTIEEVIAFMEASMEIKNEPEPIESLKY